MEYSLPKLPERPQNSNKGTFGKILNIAGSEYMRGAAYLSSVAALKVGAGYVELASCDKVLDTVSCLAPEIVLVPLSNLSLNNVTVVSIGCGLSMTSQAVNIFDKTLSLIKDQPLVIDADGLNILSQKNYKFNNNTVLTPHPKEASRLLNCSLEDILNNLEDAAKKISKKYNCITVLKNHQTIITDNQNMYVNKTGSCALAKAGSGDVLCGMISGLIAQGMKPFDAAVLGVHMHGMAGDLAAKDLSEYGVLASDLLNYIPILLRSTFYLH